MLRVYLSGHMVIESDQGVAASRDFPGRQGREAFAYLAMHRSRPIPRAELADALWGDRLPDSWGTSLSAIMSKLRAVMNRCGLDGSEALATEDGCHILRLPPGAWMDHEVAMDAVHEAETALSRDEPGRAYGPSAIAHHISRRPFLPGAEESWIEGRRGWLANILVRSLECRAGVYLWNEEAALAIEAAREVVAMRPFRESGYRLLMRGHASGGNSAEALRVYEECRALIADEFGVAPSRETKEVHSAVLQAL